MLPLQRRGDWVITQVGPDMLVDDISGKNLHLLSSNQVHVWGACDGTRTIDHIATHCELDTAEVERIIHDLTSRGLIIDAQVSAVRPPLLLRILRRLTRSRLLGAPLIRSTMWFPNAE